MQEKNDARGRDEKNKSRAQASTLWSGGMWVPGIAAGWAALCCPHYTALGPKQSKASGTNLTFKVVLEVPRIF